MFMQDRSITDYLVRRGQLTHKELVSGSLQVVNHTRRNQNYSVRRKDASPSFFVKQLKNRDSRLVESFRQEANLHRLILQHDDFKALARYVPECIGYDARNELLVFEFLQQYRTIFELRSDPEFSREAFAAQLGAVLADIHHNMGRQTRANPQPGQPFPCTTPWVLMLHNMPVTVDETVTQGMVDYVALLRTNPAVVQLLKDVRASWQINSLTHNDLSWSNIIYSDELSTLKLIDWELADLGDAAWDVGMVLQNFLIQTVLTNSGFNQPVQQAQAWMVPLTSAHAELSAFLGTYLQFRQFSAYEQVEFLQRAIRCGAARAVLSGYENHHAIQELLPVSQSILDFALTLYCDSTQVAHTLLKTGADNHGQ